LNIAPSESLMEKGDLGRSLEEEALLELLINLIGQYENAAYHLPEGRLLAH